MASHAAVPAFPFFTSPARSATVRVDDMRLDRVLRYTVVYGIAVGLGAAVSASCFTVTYPTIAFRCNPQIAANGCPETHFCCSDDPAAQGGALPKYRGRDIEGARNPFFSGQNNQLSGTGMCVNLADVPEEFALQDDGAFGCLVPCNPTWSSSQVREVCGRGAICCQTVALEPNDCVTDSETGDLRPVTGADIGGGVSPATRWRPSDHSTHQDPSGTMCGLIADGDSAIRNDCYAQLSVANQRGFCVPETYECGESPSCDDLDD